MGGLFWRIFLSFAGAMVVIILGVAVGTRLLTEVDMGRESDARREALADVADGLPPLLEANDHRGLTRTLQEAGRRMEAILVLRDMDRGIVVAASGDFRPGPAAPGSPAPPGGRQRNQAPPIAADPDHAISFSTGDQRTYVLAAGFSPQSRVAAPVAPVRLLQLAFAILVAATVCFLLARRIVSPIARLRRGAQQLAEGRLDTRIGGEFSGRRDELGDLARDFDRMAEQLQMLLDNQHRLVRDISHELRSPLARLQVALGLARQRAGGQVDPELDRIQQEAESLEEIVSQILLLMQMDSEGRFVPEPVSLRPFLEALTEDVAFEGQARGVDIRVSGEDVQAWVDAGLLHHALENVLRNALRYSPEGRDVVVELEHAAGAVVIRVRDHGPGVPEESLERIFEPFFRVSASREHEGGTGGVGLAIARRAVARHGGHIRAYNAGAPDSGLVIEISLPGD